MSNSRIQTNQLIIYNPPKISKKTNLEFVDKATGNCSVQRYLELLSSSVRATHWFRALGRILGSSSWPNDRLLLGKDFVGLFYWRLIRKSSNEWGLRSLLTQFLLLFFIVDPR